MKPNLIILTFIGTLTCISVMGQSTFVLQNINPFSGIDAPVFDAEGNRLEGATFAAELWGGVTSDSLAPTLDFTTHQRLILPFLTGVAAGYFASTAEMTVVGSFPGDFAWVQVRAWNTQLGTTWEEVATLGMGGYGESSLLFLQGGNPNADPPIAPHYLIGLQSFSLRPVPEPAVWQLSIIGFAALLFLRRKGAG